MILQSKHWFVRFLSRHITITNRSHCAWCGEMFEYEVGLGNQPPTYCSNGHRKRSAEARRRRKTALETEKALAAKLPRGNSKRDYDSRFPVPEKDEVARSCHVPITRIGLSVPINSTCHYCPDKATTKDHIVPKAAGGSNYYWNLVPACAWCNRRKSSKPTTCKCEFCARAKELHLLLQAA